MRFLTTAAGVGLLLAAPATLLAQTAAPPRLMRGDISGTVGWVNVNKSDFGSYNHWHAQGGSSLAAGWYWSDHHKTLLEIGTTTETEVYSSEQIFFSGQPNYVSTFSTFRSRRVAVIQHYQFRRNEWAHPFVGAGVDIVRERERRQDKPVFAYDPVLRQSRQLRGEVRYPERTDMTARGILTAGVKAYFTRNVFGLTDLRVSVGRRRVEDVQWRFGLGLDF